MYTAIEEARGRALLELLANPPLVSQGRSKELQEGERRISGLQRRLLHPAAKGNPCREGLLMLLGGCDRASVRVLQSRLPLPASRLVARRRFTADNVVHNLSVLEDLCPDNVRRSKR